MRILTSDCMEFLKSVPAVWGLLVVLWMSWAPSGHIERKISFLELYSRRLKSWNGRGERVIVVLSVYDSVAYIPGIACPCSSR